MLHVSCNHSFRTFTVTGTLTDWRVLLHNAPLTEYWQTARLSIIRALKAKDEAKDEASQSVAVTFQSRDWLAMVGKAIAHGLVAAPITADNASSNVTYHANEACRCAIGERGGLYPTVERWKANGAVKRWKRDAARFKVPVKHGLYAYGYVDETNGAAFHLEADCPYGNR